MKYVETQILKTGIINNTIKKSVPVKKYNNVNYSKNKVTVEIPVEKYTEASMKIPIEAINQPDNIQLQVIPQEITVNYFVCLSYYERISPDDFTAIIDYSSINNSIGNRLDVKLIKFPEFIANIKYKPKSIDYLIEKK
ncbi:MAG: hypothetical protein HY738_16320 [Bacteroidia bacterium]|nr:hypothetical protein [Bacteroidia bacterium]